MLVPSSCLRSNTPACHSVRGRSHLQSSHQHKHHQTTSVSSCSCPQEKQTNNSRPTNLLLLTPPLLCREARQHLAESITLSGRRVVRLVSLAGTTSRPRGLAGLAAVIWCFCCFRAAACLGIATYLTLMMIMNLRHPAAQPARPVRKEAAARTSSRRPAASTTRAASMATSTVTGKHQPKMWRTGRLLMQLQTQQQAQQLLRQAPPARAATRLVV